MLNIAVARVTSRRDAIRRVAATLTDALLEALRNEVAPLEVLQAAQSGLPEVEGCNVGVYADAFPLESAIANDCLAA